jgi:hypothetical protein
MTRPELYQWLAWRKELGLPHVPQKTVNDLLNDRRTFIIDQPRSVQAFRKVTYLWGLIKVYKPIKLDK